MLVLNTATNLPPCSSTYILHIAGAGGAGHNGDFIPTKVALSLYKVQQSIYLLDFQRVEGDSFSFMKICSMIITELKNLSAASRAMQQMQLNASKGAHAAVPMPPPNP